MSEQKKSEEKVEKKLTEQELKGKIFSMETTHKKALESVDRTTAQTLDKIKGKAGGEVRANHLKKDEKLTKARSTRDIIRREATKARELAIKQAQSTYDQAVNSADKTFDEISMQLEQETKKLSEPIEAEMKAAEAQVRENRASTIRTLKADFEEAVSPLRKELFDNYTSKKVKAAKPITPEEVQAAVEKPPVALGG